jgi:hypothetical protein
VEDLSKIKERIAKLLAKAEKTDNEHERETFMAKVNEMLEQYQIELHEIRKMGGKVADPLGNNAGDVASSDAWIFRVTGAAAKYFGCRIVWEQQDRNNMKRKPYRVFGRESGRAVFELMLPYLISQVKQQGRRMSRDLGDTVSRRTREVGLAFATRLLDLAVQADIHRAEVTKNALVPLDVTKETKQMVDNYYPSLKSAPKMRTGFTASARDYANQININTQVGHNVRSAIR